MRRTRAIARLELLGSALAFGVMAVLARRLSQGPEPFSAGQLTVVRFASGAVASLVFFRLQPGSYRPRDLRLLWSRGISGGIVVVLYFWALARIPAGEAGMIFNLFPVLATILSALVLRGPGEARPTVHLGLALLVATAGVAMVLGQGPGGFRLGVGVGEALALAAACFAALSAVLIRAARATENAPTIFFYFCVGGLPVALPFALGPWPSGLGAWAGAAGIGLASLLAQGLMTEAYGALSVGEAAVWLQLTPLAQYALAGIVLGEGLSGAGFAGVLLGMAGVAYGTLYGHRRRAERDTPDVGANAV